MSKFDLMDEPKLYSDHHSSFRDVIKKWFKPSIPDVIVFCCYIALFSLSTVFSGLFCNPVLAGNMIGVMNVTSVSQEYVTRTFALKNLSFEEARLIASSSKSPKGSIYVARSVNTLIVRDKLENIMQIERNLYLRQNGLTDTRQVMVMARIEDIESGKIVATPSFSLLKGMTGRYDHFTDLGQRDENGIVGMIKTGISVQIVPTEIKDNNIDFELTADIRDIVNDAPVSYKIVRKQSTKVKKPGRIVLKPENFKTAETPDNKGKIDKNNPQNENNLKKGYIFRYVLSII